MQTGNNYVQPKITEHKIISETNRVLARLTTAITIILFIGSIAIFRFSPINTLVLGTVLLVFQTILSLFLVKPKVIQRAEYTQVIQTPVYQTIEKPVIKYRTKEVEKPVYKYKTKYITKPRKKLNIPRYEFVASTETERFHKRNCRLGKLIKRKHKLSNNYKSYFTHKRFAACKACLA